MLKMQSFHKDYFILIDYKMKNKDHLIIKHLMLTIISSAVIEKI